MSHWSWFHRSGFLCGPEQHCIRSQRRTIHGCPAKKNAFWEPSFRQKSFQKPSILSGQAARSGSPPGPRSKNFTLFLERFSDARVYRFLRQTHSGAAFFATSKKWVQKILQSTWDGASSGTRFCMYCYHNKQNKKAKTKKTQVLFRTVITIKHFAFSQRAPKCFIAITVLNKTCVLF